MRLSNTTQDRINRTGAWEPLIPTDHHEAAERNREIDRKSIERGMAMPAQGWKELASWADEGSWLRVLEDHRETSPAVYEQLVKLRPPYQSLIDEAT